MELIFLGSGAGELWPSPFCDCDACRAAVAARGKAAKIASCMLVDRRYLFDLPPNAGLRAIELGVSLAGVRRLFVTHSHQDHFDPCVLADPGRAGGGPLHLYCNRRLAELLPVYQQFNRFFDPEKLNLDIHVLDPFDTSRPEDGAFELTALPADHDTTGGEEPLIYLFESDGKTILYACDTGWLPEATWREVEQRQYDAVVLECTFHELQESRRGHLSMEPFLAIKERFVNEALLKEGAYFVAQHLAHGHEGQEASPDELAPRFAAHGVTPAYDGMILNL